MTTETLFSASVFALIAGWALLPISLIVMAFTDHKHTIAGSFAITALTLIVWSLVTALFTAMVLDEKEKGKRGKQS